MVKYHDHKSIVTYFVTDVISVMPKKMLEIEILRSIVAHMAEYWNL
jgi:hypothetical protein